MNLRARQQEHTLFSNLVLMELLSNYTQRHRAYHNTNHLKECFAEFDEISKHLDKPTDVELALWFHDAVYDPSRNDNEKCSAKLLQERFEYRPYDTTYAQKLILATKKHLFFDFDSAHFLDIDMSILGKDIARVHEYEKQIRQEHKMYSDIEYKTARLKFLTSLKSERIFKTNHFHEKYGSQAQGNVEQLKYLITKNKFKYT